MDSNLGTMNKKINDRNYYLKHKTTINQQAKLWRKEHPIYVKEYNAMYYDENKTRLLTASRKWHFDHQDRTRAIKYNSYTKNRDLVRQRRREITLDKRLKLLDILGGRKCIKCGYSQDTRALTFDHLRDDGHEDRRIHYSAYGFYSFYIKNPDIAKANLQVLCCNCNNIKKYDLMRYTIR